MNHVQSPHVDDRRRRKKKKINKTKKKRKSENVATIDFAVNLDKFCPLGIGESYILRQEKSAQAQESNLDIRQEIAEYKLKDYNLRHCNQLLDQYCSSGTINIKKLSFHFDKNINEKSNNYSLFTLYKKVEKNNTQKF